MELIAKYYETPVAEPLQIPIAAGMNIGELVDSMQLPEHLRSLAVATNGTDRLDDDYTIVEGDKIIVGLAPAGDEIIPMIIMIGIAVAAPQLAALAFKVGTPGFIAATAAITIAGSLAVSALIPPPAAPSLNSQGSSTARDVYFASGTANKARYFENVPSIYGTHRIYADLAAKPRIDSTGTVSEIALLFDAGIGDVEVTDSKIGDTPITALDLEVLAHRNTKNPTFKYINNLNVSQSFNIKLLEKYGLRDSTTVADSEWTVLTTPTDTSKIELVFYLPEGAGYPTSIGKFATLQLLLRTEYRLAGSATWTPFQDASPNIAPNPGTHINYGSRPINNHDLPAGNVYSLHARSAEPFFLIVSASGLTPGTYEVRAVRGFSYQSRFDFRLYDNAYLRHTINIVELKSFKVGSPVSVANDKKHTFIELHGVASEKLSGQIETFNFVAKRHIRDISATGFLPKVATSNPALIALDILAGEENPQPLQDAQIDFASFKKLRDICDAGQFTFNGVIRDDGTVSTQVSKVLSNARAQLSIEESGKFGVIIDEAGKTPRQMITPSNSWDFSGSRTFPVYPDAIRVTYTEPKAGYDSAEVVVYQDGKDELNTETFEDLPTVGITSKAEAWRYGRYMMAQAIMRNETFTLKMDVEHLAVQRGSIVTVQHDVPKFGGVSARVKSVAGAVVTIDQTFAGSGVLGVRARLADGTIKTQAVASALDDVVTLSAPISGLDYGDLLVIGELGKETQDYIVLAVRPDSNLSAELTLTPYVAGVYTADTGTIPDWQPGFGIDFISGTDLSIAAVTTGYRLEYENRQPLGMISLAWTTAGSIATLDHYNIYKTGVDGVKQLVATTTLPFYNETVHLLANSDAWHKDYKYEIEPVNTLATTGTSGSANITILPDETPPDPVNGFGVNIVNNSSVELFWHLSNELDIDHYDLRYTPETANPSWSMGLGLARIDYRTNRTSVGARTGTYMISVVDTSGNSSTPKKIRTSVETLPDLDLIEIVDDKPDGWLGKMDQTTHKRGGVTLHGDFGNVAPAGFYYFKTLFDAGEIDELRVQAKIKAYGIREGDIIANWVPLASAIPLVKSSADEWDCWLEVRTSEVVDVIANWLPLASAVPLAGSSTGWQPWRRVESADVTGKIFQFRIALVSRSKDVNVQVQEAQVEIDVLERTVSYPDVEILPADVAAGKTISFNPPFRSIPAIAVSIDGNAHDVAYEVTNKTASSVNIRLLDNAATGTVYVAGKFDLTAVGWGRRRLNPL